MITNGKYILRKGVERDRSAKNWIGTISNCKGKILEDIPDYVLLYENQQVGALHGDAGHIRHIEIFEEFRNRGHGKRTVMSQHYYKYKMLLSSYKLKVRIWKKTDAELIHHLKQEDLNSPPDRLERIRFLAKALDKAGYLSLHGELSPFFFEEARLCYLNGQFIACEILR